MTNSVVMTESDPLCLLFEPLYSSFVVTISSLHFITTCMHISIYIYIRCIYIYKIRALSLYISKIRALHLSLSIYILVPYSCLVLQGLINNHKKLFQDRRNSRTNELSTFSKVIVQYMLRMAVPAKQFPSV